MDLPVAEPPLPSAAPISLRQPDTQRVPLVFASPHSGRAYPPDFIAAARLDTLGLRRSEDSFVDALFEAAPGFGAPLLSATFPRAYCDPNREPWELDPAMFADDLPAWVNTTSPRVGAGLGTIARVVASGEAIYREKLPFAEAERRVRTCWEPFHDALFGLIGQTKRAFGACLLIDCHSMPAHAAQPRHGLAGTASGGAAVADFVLGDAHGTSCAPRITALVEQTLRALGYTVRRNDPYAGGYITRHYGRPREGVHVLQIEVARALYMDEARIERLPRFGALQRDLTALIATLAADAPTLLAA
ncbi:MAG: N-formylglutamate amidohydrolase [Proteobacteria bacterium]|nr:N-formylglutamate amidohydrolase [Pseudomonadota bacterium]